MCRLILQNSHRIAAIRGAFALIAILFLWGTAWGQSQKDSEQVATPDAKTRIDKPEIVSPKAVDVQPLANDEEIAQRLKKILEATTWFQSPEVRVDQGVVFMSGVTSTEDFRKWASDLAGNTQDVVAVVNQIRVTDRSIWDLNPAWLEVEKLGRQSIQMLPLLIVAIVFIALSWFAAGWSIKIARRLLSQRVENGLLLTVITRSIAIPVFLFGLYLALRVSGLTQIAATVVGGTGLLGLILGIAFRDIAENFLASILISVQRPFALGDFIEVDGHQGIVQSVTARGTLLMTPDGNHLQIPNSSIYKSVILNGTANPNVRCEFGMGIGYDDSVPMAQGTILSILEEHEAVLKRPEPMVILEELGRSTVNLRCFFWIDGHTHSKLKVLSSVIHKAKVAIQQAGISLPDESRELIFPRDVPVRIIEAATDPHASSKVRNGESEQPIAATESTSENSTLDSDLTSEKKELEEQARHARQPEQGENLLKA